MKIYVIRHGQTDWNVQKKIQGSSDIELNSVGIAQAEEAREKVKALNIDIILCSPLKRARKTAEIIAENTGIPIIYEECFKERFFGDFEGSKLLETPILLSETLFDVNENYREKNVESINDVMSRVSKKLDEIKEKYKDKNVLIVTHGGVLRAINAYFNGIPESGIIISTKVENGEIREYEFKD